MSDLLDRALALATEANARADAATPGPWHNAWDTPCDVAPPFDDDEQIIVSDAPGLASRNDRTVVGLIYYDGEHIGCTRPNSSFIAHARTDVPALCEVVRELVEEHQILRKRLDTWHEQLVAEVAKVRAATIRECEAAIINNRPDEPDDGFDDLEEAFVDGVNASLNAITRMKPEYRIGLASRDDNIALGPQEYVSDE